jgi:tetratricopeptide (TPR) repeat protein
MCARRINPAAWLLIGLAWLVLPSGIASGQSPEPPKTDEILSPEQMAEDALKKIETGDFQEAAALLRRAKTLKPKLDKLLLAEGLLAIEARRQVEAVEKLEAYNKSSEGKTDYRGFAAVGRIYKNSYMLSQAVPALKKAKDLAPLEENGKRRRAEITVDLASVYFALQQKDQAAEATKEAQKLAPDDAAVQLQLAQVAFSTKDRETAAKGAERAIELSTAALRGDPLKKETYQLLASCYRLQGNLAQEDLGANPDASMNYLKIAQALRQMAEMSHRISLLDACEAMKQALAKDPDKPEYLLFSAALEIDLGAYDEAREKVERVLQSSPDNREALELRHRLKVASGTSSKE